ncbi:hypothetical protein CALCODRAFT_106168 [Calocera cornea HHB12733]|uniref:Uncharacterized protein n=1 Tax=Calocera cornea HHB12733 TaxID=1353952 RepID=A0A165IFQ0_9BASI|nr:hypothetical protein CALCODRAFT_106168 [Calocera cornea HHB12733]
MVGAVAISDDTCTACPGTDAGRPRMEILGRMLDVASLDGDLQADQQNCVAEVVQNGSSSGISRKRYKRRLWPKPTTCCYIRKNNLQAVFAFFSLIRITMSFGSSCQVFSRTNAHTLSGRSPLHPRQKPSSHYTISVPQAPQTHSPETMTYFNPWDPHPRAPRTFLVCQLAAHHPHPY